MKTETKDNCYNLINSLSMSEKRYFKVYSSKHILGSQNSYIPLFNALDSLQEDDDAKLKKILERKKVNATYLSADKNYLFNLILRSLTSFHHNKSHNLIIKDLLSSIEILFHKGLYLQCLRLITRAQNLAEECENFSLLLDVLTWKRRCMGYSQGLAEAGKVNRLMNKYLKLSINLKQFTDLYYKSYSLKLKEEKTNAEVTEKFKLLIEHPLLKDESQARSFTARIFFHLIYSHYYFVLGDKKSENKHNQAVVDMSNSSPLFCSENPLDYISIYNRVLAFKQDGPIEKFYEDIDRLRKFPDTLKISKETAQQRVFVHTYLNELEMLTKKYLYERAVALGKKIEGDLEKLHSKIEPAYFMTFYYLFAYSELACGNYSKALKYLNKLINEYKEEQKPVIYSNAMLLSIVAHFHLKHYDLLPFLTNTLANVYKKASRPMGIEQKFISFFKKIPKDSSSKNIRKELAMLRENLTNQKSGYLENFKIFDLDLWIEATLKGRTMQELTENQNI